MTEAIQSGRSHLSCVFSGVLFALGIGNRPEDGGDLANRYSSEDFEVWDNVSDWNPAAGPVRLDPCDWTRAVGPVQPDPSAAGPMRLDSCSWTGADAVFAVFA